MLEGDWQLVDHGRAISPEIVASQPLRLHRDGTVSGGILGRWRCEGRGRITLSADGQAFYGVVSQGWRESSQRWTLTFSVQGDDGRSLWGTKDA